MNTSIFMVIFSAIAAGIAPPPPETFNLVTSTGRLLVTSTGRNLVTSGA